MAFWGQTKQSVCNCIYLCVLKCALSGVDLIELCFSHIVKSILRIGQDIPGMKTKDNMIERGVRKATRVLGRVNRRPVAGQGA
jgi:hypothetical protein